MQIRELSIPNCFEVVPEQHSDDRGVFLESYRFDQLAAAVGHSLTLEQANISVSKRGTVRGIHFADVPPSQAKYVTTMRGAVMDFVVDIRIGSPTFGQWDAVRLDDVTRKSVYIAEGIGHCFVALTEGAVVHYLVSATFNPKREHGITPLDHSIGLEFGLPRSELLLSPKDLQAPTLDQALNAGILPDWEDAKALYRSKNEGRI